MRGSGSPPTKAPPALVVSRPMMTLQVLLLQLLVHCLLTLSLDSSRHERRRSFIDTAPKYSRLTPYQDEESFPQPVFGMAHGFPYGSPSKEFDKEFFKNYPSAAEGGDSSGDEYPPDSREHPRGESHPAVEDHRPRKPLPGPLKEGEFRRTEHQSNERHPEKGPPFRPTRWKGVPGRSSERKTARDSEELRPPGLRGRWRGGLHPRPAAGRSSSEEEHGSREKPRSPNGSSESAPGVGFDSRHSDGRGSGDFGAADRGSHEGRERAGRRTTTAGKIVGVDMQMVAGMYPKDQSSPYPGRFSPLSGPFPEEQEESEAERFTSEEGRREPWRRLRPQNRSRKYRKNMGRRYGGYGIGGDTRRRSYFGEFDAYFEPTESPHFERTTDHSSQERDESLLKPQSSDGIWTRTHSAITASRSPSTPRTHGDVGRRPKESELMLDNSLFPLFRRREEDDTESGDISDTNGMRATLRKHERTQSPSNTSQLNCSAEEQPAQTSPSFRLPSTTAPFPPPSLLPTASSASRPPNFRDSHKNSSVDRGDESWNRFRASANEALPKSTAAWSTTPLSSTPSSVHPPP